LASTTGLHATWQRRTSAIPLLEVRDLVKHFPAHGGLVHAVNGVSFTLERGSTLGLVGESGSGKTTVARCVTRLVEASSGQILFEDRDITHLGRGAFRPLRARMQMVFQDPADSLNPRIRVGELVEEPLWFFTTLSKRERLPRVRALFQQVQLDDALIDRYPRQLSGGQQQRVAIARAIATNPGLVVLDEPTSALDVSVRRGVVELLRSLQESLGIAYLLISHDLTTVEWLSGTIAVLYLGRVAEFGRASDVLNAPSHPYTDGLLASRLTPDPALPAPQVRLSGEIPSAFHLPPGCPLQSRCPEAIEVCARSVPALRSLTGAPGHSVACLRRATDAGAAEPDARP
jgi:oligopeptide/dipeptide ABC transporter ATP-binding protein